MPREFEIVRPTRQGAELWFGEGAFDLTWKELAQLRQIVDEAMKAHEDAVVTN